MNTNSAAHVTLGTKTVHAVDANRVTLSDTVWTACSNNVTRADEQGKLKTVDADVTCKTCLKSM